MEFPEGIRIYPPHKNAPTWIKGQVVIEVSDFYEYLKKHREEQGKVRLDLKEGKSGALYFQLNSWKKQESQEAQEEDLPTVPF